MTRINVVPPSVLSNQHLMAEYRELPRIFTAVRKLQDQGKTPDDIDIPESYRLGSGHVKYFYDKLDWLIRRYFDIHQDLIRRKYNLDRDLYSSIFKGTYEINKQWFGTFDPTYEDIYLNMARLAKRSKMENVLDELGRD
jgi:deoxyribonuclease (pyrimidine dimer)